MSAESLRKDSEELVRLYQLTENVNVKRILTHEAVKLRQLADLEQASASGRSESNSASKLTRNATYTTKLVNYAWDQSDKFFKIYVTLNGVHSFPAENVTVEYGPKFFELQALDPAKKNNNVLTIRNLLHEIIPSQSYHKVKSDMVVLYLKKTSIQHWSFVTESEKKAKEPKAPKFEKEEDAGASLMTLMKQMYDDGDDEMKRTIAKAWTEARDKKTDEVV